MQYFRPYSTSRTSSGHEGGGGLKLVICIHEIFGLNIFIILGFSFIEKLLNYCQCTTPCTCVLFVQGRTEGTCIQHVIC